MSNKTVFIITGLVVVIVAALFIWNKQRQSQSNELVIGTSSAFTIILNAAAAEAKKQGINVKVVEFSDWRMPNVALNNGDIDANFFQHRPFLSNAIKEGGYKIKVFGTGTAANVGLYSKKYSSLDALPEKARVAIPNDPVNEGHALIVLEQAKLIQLKDSNNHLSTLQDITANPKNLQFIQMEGPQTARAVDDVDLAFSYPQYLKLAKTIDPEQALLFNKDKRYAIVFVVRDDYVDKNDQLKKFVDIYQNSPEVKAALDQEIGKSLWYPGW